MPGSDGGATPGPGGSPQPDLTAPSGPPAADAGAHPADGGYALAIDIGGTKLAVGVVDRSGRLLEHLRGATPRPDGPDAAESLYRALTALVGRLVTRPAR